MKNVFIISSNTIIFIIINITCNHFSSCNSSIIISSNDSTRNSTNYGITRSKSSVVVVA